MRHSMVKLKEIEEIPPVESRCISVSSPDKMFGVGPKDYKGKHVMTHNSVIQNNIVIGCILRPDYWRFLGIDLKRVELSVYRQYSEVVQGIATELADALTILRFGQQTMMKRYNAMEDQQKQNFKDLPGENFSLLIMVDEAAELLSPSGVKALSGKTVVPTPEGDKRLEDLKVGASVFDNYGAPTKITHKYIPQEQKRFDMSIRSVKTGVSETFVSGSEHNWVAYFYYPDGEIEGPKTVDTTYLHEFKNAQRKLPVHEQVQVKFKRG